MGSWGTAISSNDTYADVHSAFFDLYNEGLEVVEISKKLIAENQDIIKDPDDCNNFWFALAKAQWECKQLDPKLFLQVKEVIETGSDLDVWRQLEADEKDIKKRKIVLDKFLLDLQVEKTKPKSRKKKVIRQPVFEKGDCLTFKLENGNYGGAIVLEAIKDTEYGYNLIATTRINQINKPTKEDFEKSEVLITKYANFDNKPNIHWYLPVRHKNVSHLIEKVATITVKLDYSSKQLLYGHVGDFDIWIIGVANQQFDFEKTKQCTAKRLTIKDLTQKKSWWKI